MVQGPHTPFGKLSCARQRPHGPSRKSLGRPHSGGAYTTKGPRWLLYNSAREYFWRAWFSFMRGLRLLSFNVCTGHAHAGPQQRPGSLGKCYLLVALRAQPFRPVIGVTAPGRGSRPRPLLRYVSKHSNVALHGTFSRPLGPSRATSGARSIETTAPSVGGLPWCCRATYGATQLCSSPHF